MSKNYAISSVVYISITLFVLWAINNTPFAPISGSIVISFSALIVGRFSYLHAFNQERTSIYLSCSNRYTSIISKFFSLGYNFDTEFDPVIDHDKKNDHIEFSVDFWYLVNEEFLLRKNKKISGNLWKLWMNALVEKFDQGQFLDESWIWAKTNLKLDDELDREIQKLFKLREKNRVHEKNAA